MVRIQDISDKGRKQGKRLRYEIGYYCLPNPDTSEELPEIIAKFKSHGDAWRFAQLVANSPDATLVIIRS